MDQSGPKHLQNPLNIMWMSRTLSEIIFKQLLHFIL